MDSQRYGLTVGLLAHDSLNVHDIFEPIDRSDFASTAFGGGTGDWGLGGFAGGERTGPGFLKKKKTPPPPPTPVSNGARAIGII